MLSLYKFFVVFTLGVTLLTMLLFSELNSYVRLDESPVFTNRLSGLTSHKRYLVSSESCKIPDLNFFDKSIARFVRRQTHTACRAHPPLTVVEHDDHTKSVFLVVDQSALQYYSSSGDVTCCVNVIRDTEELTTTRCLPLNGRWRLSEKCQYLVATCRNSTGSVVYKNLHATVVRNKNVEPKLEGSGLNVLLIGIDSISRLNLYRSLPLTTTHLHTHGWTELRGYNKIADNTLPNLMALLAGTSPGELSTAYLKYFDHYPFIWKEFTNASYVTAYAEDKHGMGTFECNLKGFKNKPTHHYTRSFFRAGEENFTEDPKRQNCLGFKSSSGHLFSYLLDFVRVYKDDSFFGLFWANDFSHNNLNQPSAEDSQVLDLLKQLESAGTLNKTMVMFFSDHGLRVGDYRKTKLGYYEDRLPFFFVSLPQWYKDLNAAEYSNLLNNADNLVSPYDVYTTLSYVLHRDQLKTPAACVSCRSLLSEIPRDRSCSDAGISPHWCSCHELSELPVHPFSANYWANLIVDAVNSKLKTDKDLVLYFICETLRLAKVLYLRKKLSCSRTEYVVGVETSPGGGQFEGTVVKNGLLEVVEDSVSRINEYGQESHCVYNPISKMFCFCKDLLEE